MSNSKIPKIVMGLLVKNEKGKFIEEYLDKNLILCDRLVVLDDKSDDGTLEYIQQFNENESTIPINIFTSNKSHWGTAEWKQRKRLFDLCNTYANERDWITIVDCDELICNPIELRNFMLDSLADSISVRFYDMWNTCQYRSDKYWQAHLNPFLFAIRKNMTESIWNNTPLHCGRWPMVQTKYGQGDINTSFQVKHMGWASKIGRLKKYKRYMNIDPNGEYGWMKQYCSIIDENPNLIDFVEDSTWTK